MKVIGFFYYSKFHKIQILQCKLKQNLSFFEFILHKQIKNSDIKYNLTLIINFFYI